MKVQRQYEQKIRTIWYSLTRESRNAAKRGVVIKVDPAWQSFDGFYEWAIKHYWDGSKMIRKSRSSPYEPANCHFVPNSKHKKKPITPFVNLLNMVRGSTTFKKFGYEKDFFEPQKFFEWAKDKYFEGCRIIRKDVDGPYSFDNCFLGSKEDAKVSQYAGFVKHRKKKAVDLVKQRATEVRRRLMKMADRGEITICEEWRDKTVFTAWYRSKYIERSKMMCVSPINHYSPQTCVFRLYNVAKFGDEYSRKGGGIYACWYANRRKMECEWASSIETFVEWCKTRYVQGLVLMRKDASKLHSPDNSFWGKVADRDMSLVIPRMKQTCLDRYGSEWASSNIDVRKKVRAANIEKYGVPNPLILPHIQEKSKQSKIRNGTWRQKTTITFAQQNTVAAYVESLGLSQRRDLAILDGKEIDIYCEDEKIGIEYCGMYWHSSPDRKVGRSKHHFKYEVCKSKGIKLLTIFENELKHRKVQLEAMLSREFGKLSIVDGFELKPISNEEASSFIEINEIVPVKCHAGFGLFRDGELISAAGIRKIRCDGRLILSTKAGLDVAGGDVALVATANKWCKLAGLNLSAVTDNRHGWGERYAGAGFILKEEKGPRVAVFDNKTKNIVSKKIAKGIMSGNIDGDIRYIWDCGTRNWVYGL